MLKDRLLQKAINFFSNYTVHLFGDAFHICWPGNICFSALHWFLEFTVVSCEVSPPNQKSHLMTKKTYSFIRSTDSPLWLGPCLSRLQNLLCVIRKTTLAFCLCSTESRRGGGTVWKNTALSVLGLQTLLKLLSAMNE